jgi:hypothetical protein
VFLPHMEHAHKLYPLGSALGSTVNVDRGPCLVLSLSRWGFRMSGVLELPQGPAFSAPIPESILSCPGAPTKRPYRKRDDP